MKLVRRLANLGYGSRRAVTGLLRSGRVIDQGGRTCSVRDTDDGGTYQIDGEPMDPRPTLILALHKPRGLETTRSGTGPTVYDPLPARFLARSPVLAPVGRLDKDTSGLLLFTDDGPLLHRLTHPRHHVDKDYFFETARPINASAQDIFAAGTLLLRGERTPLRPATLQLNSATTGVLTLREGRYHQARRMWAAVGNHVVQLHRVRVGPIDLTDLPEGQWRVLSAPERTRLRASVGLPPD